jgi:hypothetical protein
MFISTLFLSAASSSRLSSSSREWYACMVSSSAESTAERERVQSKWTDWQPLVEYVCTHVARISQGD